MFLYSVIVCERELDAVKKAGYRIAFTTEARNIDLKREDLFLVPRMAINTYGGYWENLAKVTGIWQKIIGA